MRIIATITWAREIVLTDMAGADLLWQSLVDSRVSNSTFITLKFLSGPRLIFVDFVTSEMNRSWKTEQIMISCATTHIVY